MTVPWEALAFLALLACLFTGLAAHRLLRERALRRDGVRTHAVVVRYDEHLSVQGDASVNQAPVVEFHTADGRAVRARSTVSSSAPSLAPGRAVTVFYNPDDPSEVAIVGHGRGILGVFLTVGLGLFAVDAVLALGSEDLLTRLPMLIPVVLGVAFLGIGGYGAGRIWFLRLRGGRAEGVVVGETTSSTHEGLTLHHPVVRFRLPNGHEVQSASERGRVLRRAREGQAVRVCYHPADPHRIVLSRDGARPVFVIFTAVGIVILAVTIAIVRMMVRS